MTSKWPYIETDIWIQNPTCIILAYDFEVFLRGDVGEKNGIYTWREAKNYCMSLKDGWQLVIIDSEDKQQKVREAFEAAGAEDGDAAWIGFENDDGKNFYGAHNFSPTLSMLVTNARD